MLMPKKQTHLPLSLPMFHNFNNSEKFERFNKGAINHAI